MQTDRVSRGGFVSTMLNMPAIDFDQPPPELKISVSSISETVRSKIPSKKRKYDTNDKINALYEKYFSEPNSDISALYGKLVFEFYDLYKPRIISIARKHRSVSAIFDEEDLRQSAMEAIFGSFDAYRHREDIEMRFATFLEWKIRNMFQRALGTKDKFVEIYTKDEQLKETMEYHKFITKKKALLGAGHTYLIKNRTCQYSEVHEDKNHGEEDNAIYTVLGKYHPDASDDTEDKTDEDAVEREEKQSENDETNNDAVDDAAEEDPKPSPRKRKQLLHPVQASNNGHNDNMQIIDGIYRCMRNQQNRRRRKPAR